MHTALPYASAVNSHRVTCTSPHLCNWIPLAPHVFICSPHRQPITCMLSQALAPAAQCSLQFPTARRTSISPTTASQMSSPTSRPSTWHAHSCRRARPCPSLSSQLELDSNVAAFLPGHSRSLMRCRLDGYPGIGPRRPLVHGWHLDINRRMRPSACREL